jgi:hypothetical protein
MAKGIKVQAIRPHTFAGKDYEPGDTYTVSGDAHQTVDQYVDTLRGSGLAKAADDEGGPNIVEEIRTPDEAAAAKAAARSTAVEPLSTENIEGAPVAQPKVKGARAAKSAVKAPRKARAAKK